MNEDLTTWIQHAVRDERAADSECFAQPPRAGGKKAQGDKRKQKCEHIFNQIFKQISNQIP